MKKKKYELRRSIRKRRKKLRINIMKRSGKSLMIMRVKYQRLIRRFKKTRTNYFKAVHKIKKN